MLSTYPVKCISIKTPLSISLMKMFVVTMTHTRSSASCDCHQPKQIDWLGGQGPTPTYVMCKTICYKTKAGISP